MTHANYERLSAVDAAFLAIEDECTHMHIGSVSVFEAGPLALEGGGIDIGSIRHLIDVQMHKTPRFRQKLAYVPLTLTPVWIDDPSFNMDYHVRHTALPHPGGVRQLERLASRVMSQRLDRRRPLWELWVVEGVEENRFALISKVHHAMVDGVSGLDLATAMVGRSPDFRPGAARAWIPRTAPGPRDLLQGEAAHRASTVWKLLRDGLGGLSGRRAGGRDESTAARLRKAGAALTAAVETAPETPLNGEIGPNRRFAWLRTPLDVVREIRQAAGGKLNDVVLAIVSGAVRRFLMQRGCRVQGLDFRAMVPVNVRASDERGQLGNRISSIVVHLPLEAEDPVERLRLVSESTRELKESGQIEGGQMVTGLFELLPPRVARSLERMAARRSGGNLVVTNVPGAPFTAYMLGARLLESYPLVPLSPTQGLNIAVLSYDDHLHWGINADYDLIPDVAEFVALLAEEAETLHKQAMARGARASAAGSTA
jgi:WS/DGAT/MGAT family acyltransferase